MDDKVWFHFVWEGDSDEPLGCRSDEVASVGEESVWWGRECTRHHSNSSASGMESTLIKYDVLLVFKCFILNLGDYVYLLIYKAFCLL